MISNQPHEYFPTKLLDIEGSRNVAMLRIKGKKPKIASYLLI